MDAVCKYCNEEVELDNDEVRTESFKCPVCDKENELERSGTAGENKPSSSGNDYICKHCGNEVEMNDSEVLANFFRCPICNKGNNLEESEADKYIGKEGISEKEKNADKKNELVLSSNDGVCKYCKEVVELDDNEIAAKSFKCPICEKENKYWFSEMDKKRIKNRLLYMYFITFAYLFLSLIFSNDKFFAFQIVWLITLPALFGLFHILASLIILSLIFIFSLFKYKLTAYRVVNVGLWLTISTLIARAIVEFFGL